MYNHTNREANLLFRGLALSLTLITLSGAIASSKSNSANYKSANKNQIIIPVKAIYPEKVN